MRKLTGTAGSSPITLVGALVVLLASLVAFFLAYNLMGQLQYTQSQLETTQGELQTAQKQLQELQLKQEEQGRPQPKQTPGQPRGGA